MPARGNILPTVRGTDDVRTIQSRLGAAARGTDQSVQQCAGITDSLRGAWGIFYASVLDYTKEEPRFWTAASQYGRGESFEDELVAWQGKIESAGCGLLVPKYDPKQDEKGSEIVRWIGIAVIAFAGAYVIGKVVPLIPKIRLPQRAGGGGDDEDQRIRVRQKEDPAVERERERAQRQRDDAERARVRAERGGAIRLGGGGGGGPHKTLPAWHGAGEVGIGGQRNWRHNVRLEGEVGAGDYTVKRAGSTIGTIQRRPDGSWLYRTPQDKVAWRGSARSRDGAARKVVLSYSW
jgi:hypothetical protein